MKTGGERLPSIRRTLTIFAMPVSPARILEDLSPFYRQEEFPVLLHQCETWAESRPLEGCRVIDASPVFRNTCAKYAALLAAGGGPAPAGRLRLFPSITALRNSGALCGQEHSVRPDSRA